MPVQEAELKPLRTKHLAAKFAMKPQALRRVLRSMPEYADGVHTNYRWAEDDKMIKKIGEKIEALKKERDAAAAKAKADLAAKKEAEKTQAAADNKAKK